MNQRTGSLGFFMRKYLHLVRPFTLGIPPGPKLRMRLIRKISEARFCLWRGACSIHCERRRIRRTFLACQPWNQSATSRSVIKSA